MNQFSRFALHSSTVLIFLAPHVAQAQWSEPEQGELFIHGGWLFDSLSDSRRRNSGRTVSVTHVWSDVGYSFKQGKPFYDESQVLERHGKAKPFPWGAEWDDVIAGELQIVNAFTPNATRRWIGFEVRPLVGRTFCVKQTIGDSTGARAVAAESRGRRGSSGRPRLL